MNVSLEMQWEEFVKEKVQSGLYQTPSEVLQEGLRLMKNRELSIRSISPQSLEELEDMVEEGIRDIEAGRVIPGDVFEKNFREFVAARRSSRE